MPVKLLKPKLEKIEKAPITFGAPSPPKSLKKDFLNWPLEKMKDAKKTEGWIEAGDPIISATFDVATGKHMVELSQKDLATKFLGPEGAVHEIERSANSGFLTHREAHRLTKKLSRICFSDPWGTDPPLYDLWKIQNFLDKRHYVSFLAWLRKEKG